MRKLFLIAVISLVLIPWKGFTQTSKFIESDNENISFIGRFDFSNPKKVRFNWPGTAIQFRFTGDQLQLALSGGERNYFNVFIDGNHHSVIHVPSDSLISIKNIQGKKWHKFRLQKRTEGEMGTTVFKGIRIDEKEKIAVLKRYDRKIEFIGNSITCGYGTEGASRDEDFLPQTENVDKSYASILARAFKAETSIIAHSGIGLVRNYNDKNKISVTRLTMPQRFNLPLDMEKTTSWDFNQWQPNAVVINLGTNDYSTQPYPDKEVFKTTYINFIKTIRDKYGSIPIFCISGPLAKEPVTTIIKEMTSDYRNLYDTNVYFIAIPENSLNKHSDLGSDWHPSYQGQLKVASQILPFMATILDWNYNDEELQTIHEFKK